MDDELLIIECPSDLYKKLAAYAEEHDLDEQEAALQLWEKALEQ